LKVTPTGLKTLRSAPPQTGHTVRLSSLNDCTMSKAWSQWVQR